MKKIRKEITWTQVKAVSRTTGDLKQTILYEGVKNLTFCATKYFKTNGYDPDIEFVLDKVKELYVMTQDDFIKNATKITKNER